MRALKKWWCLAPKNSHELAVLFVDDDGTKRLTIAEPVRASRGAKPGEIEIGFQVRRFTYGPDELAQPGGIGDRAYCACGTVYRIDSTDMYEGGTGSVRPDPKFAMAEVPGVSSKRIRKS